MSSFITADGKGQSALAPFNKPTLIAHRGASAYAPEHTLAAYQLAIRQGADFAVIPGDQTKGHRIVPKLTLFGVVSTPCMVSGQESSS